MHPRDSTRTAAQKQGFSAASLVGIIVAFLDLLSCFVDREKVHLTNLILELKSGGRIPSHTPGFKKFVAAFPPPPGVEDASISDIVTTAIQTHPQFGLAGGVRYLADGKRTQPVARFDEVRTWSLQTRYGWISWIVAAVGWLTVTVMEVLEVARGRRGRGHAQEKIWPR